MPHAKFPTLLIATDVFGATPEIGQFARAISPNATLVSPTPFTSTFRVEAEAYASFTSHGGVADYAKHLGKVLSAREYCFDLAIGFSAGASALWLCLANAELEPRLPKRAVLYYGSRIREHAHLEPRRHVRLVFAEREPSFDPAELAARLRAQGNDASVIPGSAHGFMNPRSSGYDARLAATETAALKALLG